MAYAAMELFKTLKGEGGQAGREADRVRAICTFRDTDFVGMDGDGGGRFATADSLASAIAAAWVSDALPGLVVFTGGEPLLQHDEELIAAVKTMGFEIAVETNGTLPPPDGIDWICVSPKSDAPLVQQRGSELKLVDRPADAPPERFASLDFRHFWLQPMDGPARVSNTAAAIAYGLANPSWRLSLQTHKMIGIP